MVEARFWFARGVEVFSGKILPSPPPLEFVFHIAQPMVYVDSEAPSPSDICVPQTARFRLAQYAKGGDVAHYDLDSRPPSGWRWTNVNGTIHASRSVPSHRDEEPET